MSVVLLKPSIAELKELIGGFTGETKERSSFSLYPPGFSKGSLVEISGTGKTEVVAQFLTEHPEFKIAWVENKMSINPYALFQKGVELKNILFIESGGEDLWCLTQVLQSGCFQVLVSGEMKFQEKELRRFQLLAEKGALHFFILSEKPHNSWVPQLQLEASRKRKNVSLELIKKRGLG